MRHAAPHGVLAGEHIGPLALDSFLIELNRRVASHAGREQQVGHSFLLGPDGTPLVTPTPFAEVFRHELLPLLQEFAYEDFGELPATSAVTSSTARHRP